MGSFTRGRWRAPAPAGRPGVEGAKARRNVLVGADQVAGAGPGVVAAGQPAFAVLDHAHPCGRGGRRGARVADQDGLHGHLVLLQCPQRVQHIGPRRLGAAEQRQREPAIELGQPPAGLRVRPYGRVQRHGARPHRAGIGVAVGRVQRRVGVGGRHRQAAAVDQRARERMLARQVEHGVAEGAADFALGRDEVGRARRIQDVLVGGVFAFGGVAVDQRFGAWPASTSFSFQARFSASCTPLLAPRAPNGETRWAESPANTTRPWRKWSMRSQAKV